MMCIEALTQEERDARLDIGYRTTAGKHVIVELKRSERGRSMSARWLTNNCGSTYWVFEKILDAHEEYRNEPIEIVLVVGKRSGLGGVIANARAG